MDQNNLGFYLLMAIMSMAICMAIIPVMMRLAPYLGMVDSPDGRKVHVSAIPRSGGIGIVLGIIIPLSIWLPSSPFSVSLFLGCLILLIFGALDDARNLRPSVKLVGQLLAAVIVVYHGEVYVHHFPFIGVTEGSTFAGKLFTVIAIVGMINALNLSDGLDGLAGGEALLSLAAICFLAYQFDDVVTIVVAVATIGGIFGFLRFNSHPARIFMGDAGSQTLGFILAVLVVYITQQVNPVVSPVTALLLLGLPVIDSLVVFYLRARRGDSLVVAAKDHLHHRLLRLGFYHYESVIVIYSVQVILVLLAVLIPYESDLLLISAYVGVCAFLFLLLTYLERVSWRVHDASDGSAEVVPEVLEKRGRISVFSHFLLSIGISLFTVSAAVMSSTVPMDLGVSAFVLFLSLIAVVTFRRYGDGLYRLLLFVTIGFSVYLYSSYPPVLLSDKIEIVYGFFLVMTVISFIAMRLSTKDKFQITPLDYLVIIMAIVASLAPGVEYGSSSLIWMVLQMIILFYASELVIQNMKSQINGVTAAVALSLVLIAFRGAF
jgi:UDP-GlcNAc:undecaprenyl-phosphate GlcNAc-1-phosphate transferase